jgi:hypothetical protein
VTNLNIGITEPAIGRPAALRADRIRRDTLTALAGALAEDDDNTVLNALHELVDAVKQGAADVEIDALVQDIEDTSGMGRAQMPLTASDVRQLFEQAARALPAPAAVVELPRQQDRRWSA